MPFNPNIRNTHMADSQPVGNDIRKNNVKKTPKPRPVGKQKFTAPTDEQATQMQGMDPAERYKQALALMGHQLGNRQGNTGLHFNQGQRDWLQTLSVPDLMTELAGAFNRQRPHFGNPVQNGGVPSPIGPQPGNGVPQGMPGGGTIRNTAMGSSTGGGNGMDLMTAISQLRNMTGGGLQGGGNQIGYQPMLNPHPNDYMPASPAQPNDNMGGMSVTPYGSYGVPSPLSGGNLTSDGFGMTMGNGGGYMGGGTPYGGYSNGGGFMAPGQNPNMLALIDALKRRGGGRPQGNY